MGHRLELQPHLTPAEVRQRRSKAPTVVEHLRWACVHQYLQGDSMRTNARARGRSERWVWKVLYRYNDAGTDGMVDGRRRNRGERVLSEQMRHAVFEVVQHDEPPGGGAWTFAKVREWLDERHGLKVSSATAKRTMHRAGLSKQSPRASHEDADKDAQRAFKKGGSGAS